MGSTNLTTSSVANPFKRSLNFRQGSVVVDNPRETGSPSWLLANGNFEVSDFSNSQCENEM